MKRMNRKIILLPLALAAFVGLAGCGNLTSSSSKSGIIAPTSSTPTSQPGSSSSPVAAQTLSDLNKAGTYDVKGVVVALTTKSYVIHDDKAGALVHINAAPSVKLGDYVEVKQALVDGTYMPYNGLYQFSAADKTNALTVTTATGTKPTIPAATALTSAVADGWKTRGSATPSTLKSTDVTLFSWTTTAAASGIYTTLNLSGSNTVIEPTYLDSTVFPIAVGKTYDVEAYFIGYSAANNYAAVAITKATEKVVAPIAISITSAGGATSVRVAETLALTATITPSNATNKTVTWSSSDTAKATVSETGVVTGVAVADSVIITATSVADTAIKGTITLAIAEKAIASVSSLSVDSESVSLVVTNTHQIVTTVLPTDANQSVAYASDATGIATVSTSGLITAVSAGTANITVTTVGVTTGSVALTKTIAVTVTLLPGTTATTIGALLAMTAPDTTHLYQVSGILETLDHTDKNGKVFLTDPASGKTIIVFQSTTTASSITYASGTLIFKNPSDAVTTLASYKNGEMVTLNCMFLFSSSVPEIVGFFVSHVADTSAYAVTVDAATNGTVSADVTSTTYGQIVGLTMVPANGYIVGSVVVKNAQGFAVNATVNASDTNKYTFAATCYNEVVVTFISSTVTSIVITPSSLNLPFNAYTSSLTATVSGISITAIGCGNFASSSTGSFTSDIQFRLNSTSGNSEIYNTLATPTAIKSVVVTLYTAITKDLLTLSAGTAPITTAVATDNLGFVANQLIYTKSFDESSNFTYFNLGHTITSGSAYIASIVVNLY